MTQAFAGIRILDFSQVLAAPFAAQQLAMLGAEVIKIEQPGSGDMTRGLMSSSGALGMSPSYMTCNLNKRSITLDLKHPAATEIVHKLVATADAVIENLRPGGMARLGFDYQSLQELKPDLVYCSVSGYGQTGPKAELAAFDGAIQASSGMMSISGHAATGPVRAGYFAVDMATAMNAAFALAAALFRRQATGAGQHVDVAMMDTAMVMQAAQMAAFGINQTVPELLGNQSPTKNPTANVFATSDGHVQIIVLKESHAKTFFELIGLKELLDDPQFVNGEMRVKNASAVLEKVIPIIQAESTQHWLDVLNEAGIPCAAIRSLPDVAADEQFRNRPVFAEVKHPREGTPVTVVATGHTANVDAPALRNEAPRLGEDTVAVLSELGYSEREIAELQDSGAI